MSSMLLAIGSCAKEIYKVSGVKIKLYVYNYLDWITLYNLKLV